MRKLASLLSHPALPFLTTHPLWTSHDKLVVLTSDVQLFVAAWQARGSARLCFVMRRPLAISDIAHLPASPQREALLATWPVAVPGWRDLHFENGHVQLLWVTGEWEQVLPELAAKVHVFWLDGACSLTHCKGLARVSASGALVYVDGTTSAAMHKGLRTAGFMPSEQAGTPARYAPGPRHVNTPPRAQAAHAPEQHALVLGAGLAGAATAWALAQQGWRCTVLDRHAQPGQEASGNRAGLFHGVVHGHDGTHARWHRAAALAMANILAKVVAQDPQAGAAQGLLRLSTTQVDAMQALIDRLQLPSTYVQAISASQASALAGVTLTQPAWFYPQGGWVQPAALLRFYLAQTPCQGQAEVAQLRRCGPDWQALDTDGAVLAQSRVVVLANAHDAWRLMGNVGVTASRVRGQLSAMPLPSGQTGPRLPIAGAGYVLPPLDGQLLFGATAQAGDNDATVRQADHAHNLTLLTQLLPDFKQEGTPLQGRTAWRCVVPDKLPMVGAVPDTTTPGPRTLWHHPRWVSRQEGLYVLAGLGSRGLASSALGGQTLAALISGAPCPLPQSLLDATDPARFISRRLSD